MSGHTIPPPQTFLEADGQSEQMLPSLEIQYNGAALRLTLHTAPLLTSIHTNYQVFSKRSRVLSFGGADQQ